MSSPLEISTSLYDLSVLAAKAGALILDEAGKGVTFAKKQDGSPVSRADTAAQALIMEGLAHIFAGIPVIGEETPPASYPDVSGGVFVLVDPLDGTREFQAGRPDYTVNIALIEKGRPVLGVVHAPALGLCYAGAQSYGAWRAHTAIATIPERGSFHPVHARPLPEQGRIAYVSRSHRDPATENLLNGFLKNPATLEEQIHRIEVVGSSLKFVRIAEGSGDFYPRLGPTMEWDTAAGQAVLEAAGGTVTDTGGNPLTYGKISSGFRNAAFIARGQR